MRGPLELIDALVGHRHLLILGDLLGHLGSDRVDSAACGVHTSGHRWRCLVPRLRIIGERSVLTSTVLVHLVRRLLIATLCIAHMG